MNIKYRKKYLKIHYNIIFTFLSYEKVLVLCQKSLSEFLPNIYVLRSLESEKTVFTKVSVCMSVVRLASVDTITLDWIIGLDFIMEHLLRAQKVRTSSSTSHFCPIVLVLFINNIFVRNKNQICPPIYMKYRKNVEKRNSLLQSDLRWWPFSHRSYIFRLLMKNENNVRKQNYLLQKDLQLWCRVFFIGFVSIVY